MIADAYSARRQAIRRVNLFLILFLIVNAVFWGGASKVIAKWAGVPPVPSKNGAIMAGLGDAEFAYRFGAITLQNLGNMTADTTSLKDYDYKMLDRWFWLLHGLDPASDVVPMTAAYYFGGTRVPSDVAYVVRYLSAVGQNPVGSKWRWLAHAVFLARHRMYDDKSALDLAYILSKMQPIGDTLPIWAVQMPAFVLADQGDKEAARKMVENILMSSENFNQQEVNFMKSYLVEQLGVPETEVDQVLKLRGGQTLDANTKRGPTLPVPMPE